MFLERRVRALTAAGQGPAAARQVIEALGPDILGYLRSLLRDEEEAADAFSRFAESVWRTLPELPPNEGLRTWCFRLAWHAALERQEGDGGPAPGEATAVAAELRTRTAVRVARKVDALSRLREALTPEEQTILALHLEQQLSWEEIAEVLSVDAVPVDERAVEARYTAIRERLVALARERGLLD